MTAAVWLIIIVGAFAILQSRYYAKVSFKKLRYERTISKSAVFEGENLDLLIASKPLKVASSKKTDGKDKKKSEKDAVKQQVLDILKKKYIVPKEYFLLHYMD